MFLNQHSLWINIEVSLSPSDSDRSPKQCVLSGSRKQTAALTFLFVDPINDGGWEVAEKKAQVVFNFPVTNI